MDKKYHLKQVSVLILTALVAFSAWGQEYVTKSGTPVHPAFRTPASFAQPTKTFTPSGSTAGSYTIVVTPDLLPALQPLAQWKRQQGFQVEILCAASPHRDTLRALLSHSYSSSASPHFVLLAGDVDRIPAFWGKHQPGGLNSHATDLYYGEYTGDYVPEAYVGRLSATDSAEMARIVAKTIAYEQGQWAADYDRLLLVAGSESRHPAPVTTNGQIHYLSHLAAHHRPGADTVCFYNPSSGDCSDSIVTALRHANLLVNYTAHCLSSGWNNPAINTRTLDTLDNPTPAVFVNNCCLSNAFNGNCFGETLIRQPQGGAVAVIGATNETLWDEDYYWAVGAKRPPSITPTYDSLSPGAFDTLITTPRSGHTLGEMLFAGCQAVSLSGSPFDAFYWETYTLLGDPSLTLFWTEADTLQLLPPDTLMAGATTLTLHCNRPSRISLTQDTTLIATSQSTPDGSVTLSLPNALHGDSITLTATRSEAICHTLTLPVTHPAQPFLAATQHHLDDSLLTITLQNVGTMGVSMHQIHLLQDSADRSSGATMQQSPSATIHHLAPQADTILTLQLGHLVMGIEPFLNTKLALTDSLGHTYSTLQLHIALPNLYPRIAQLTVLETDSLPAHQLLPSHDYIICAALSHPADSLTLLAAGQQLPVTPQSPTTYTTTCHTSAQLQYLPLTITTHLGNWSHTYHYWLTAHQTTEPFESGDLSNLPWICTHPNPWTIDSTAPCEGHYCARSAPIGNSQKSILTLDIDVITDDTIAFRYKVSSEPGDWLYFYIDNRRAGYWSGNSGWQPYSRPITAGHHHLQWIYQKDATTDGLDDCARIDDIRLPLALWQHPSGTPQVQQEPLSTPATTSAVPTPFFLRPNPVHGTVTLTFPASAEGSTLLVYDTYGRLADKKNIPPSATSAQYSTTHLRLGTYTLLLQTGTSVRTQKMTVIR